MNSKPLNIVILHSKNTRNYGSFMMTINAVKHLAARYPYAAFYIELESVEDEQRLRAELDIDVPFTAVPSVPLFSESPNGVRDLRRLIGYRKQSRYISSLHPDLVVYLGGDDFSEYYNKHKVMVETYWAWKFSRKTRVVFLGQTMGHSPRIAAA